MVSRVVFRCVMGESSFYSCTHPILLPSSFAFARNVSDIVSARQVPSRYALVSLTLSPAQAKEFASKMLGAKLITKQTGAAGRECNAVMLAERMPPQKEYYAAILNDRARGCPVLVASNQGGMNIEDVAHDTPEAIITTPLDFENGISEKDAQDLARKLGFKEESVNNAAEVFGKLYTIFKEKDATQIEINPLAEMDDGRVLW
jgi:succinyl-CoA synthetase beta subunit